MDYELNMKNVPSSSSSSSKRTFHGRKLQYQEEVVEQSISPPSTTTTTTAYLTADSAWKTVATLVSSSKLGDGQKRQVESQLQAFPTIEIGYTKEYFLLSFYFK